MPRNPRYDILFEPCASARSPRRNRFYQVPHCTRHGLSTCRSSGGHARDEGRGRLGRGLHRILLDPSDLRRRALSSSPRSGTRSDVKAQALMTEAVHRHGALAGVELWHGGNHAAEPLRAAMPPLSPSGVPLHYVHPRADPRHGQGRHPATSGAGRRDAAEARRARRLRHRLCLCRPWLSAVPVHRPPLQPAQRRIWRQPREPRAAAARDDRG